MHISHLESLKLKIVVDFYILFISHFYVNSMIIYNVIKVSINHVENQKSKKN